MTKEWYVTALYYYAVQVNSIIWIVFGSVLNVGMSKIRIIRRDDTPVQKSNTSLFDNIR